MQTNKELEHLVSNKDLECKYLQTIRVMIDIIEE